MENRYAPGLHLLIDYFGVALLTDKAALQDAMTGAAAAAGARVLSAHFHQFPDRAGITGVVLLAESHISIHTWPELSYAAIDIFMCGDTDAHKAADHLRSTLTPERVTLREVQRNHASQPSL